MEWICPALRLVLGAAAEAFGKGEMLLLMLLPPPAPPSHSPRDSLLERGDWGSARGSLRSR